MNKGWTRVRIGYDSFEHQVDIQFGPLFIWFGLDTCFWSDLELNLSIFWPRICWVISLFYGGISIDVPGMIAKEALY